MQGLDLLPPVGVAEDTVIGHDGWLFLYQGGQRQFDYLTGAAVPTVEAVTNFVDNLKRRRAFCAERGIGHLHVVFPSKPLVKTTHLPAAFRDTVSSPYQRYYAPAVARAALQDEVLYPLDALRDLDATTSSFMRLDTHMTHAGSLAAARMILARLKGGEIPDDAFVRGQSHFWGDLGMRFGGRDLTAPEEVLRLPDPQPAWLDNFGTLTGNEGHVVVQIYPEALSRKRLLIFGDSFVMRCLKFLGVVFREVLFMRSSAIQPDIVRRFAPDMIVTSTAERYLAHVGSDVAPQDHMLDVYGDLSYAPAPEVREGLRAVMSPNLRQRERWIAGLRVKTCASPGCTVPVRGRPACARHDNGVLMPYAADAGCDIRMIRDAPPRAQPKTDHVPTGAASDLRQEIVCIGQRLVALDAEREEVKHELNSLDRGRDTPDSDRRRRIYLERHLPKLVQERRALAARRRILTDYLSGANSKGD
ncbi:MAG: hypothetical protein AAGF60_01505 [Pseudomonadota bacterium]